MGHGHKRFQTQTSSHNYQKATVFLPMICSKQSVRDVRNLHHPKCKSDRPSPSSTSSSSSFSTIDPLSPAIGCMGQVKRNNRVSLTLPTTTTTTITTHNRRNNDAHAHLKYHKLRKLFSGKNLTAIPADTTSAATAATGCGNRRSQVSSMCSRNTKVGNEKYCSRSNNNNNNNNNLISVVDLDPPLPVIKKVISGNGGDNDKTAECLWKRRFNNNNGVRLQSLQIEQIKSSSKASASAYYCLIRQIY